MHLDSHETSSEFIYKMIEAYGGTNTFYKQFFISAVSPIGFIKDGKNYNYYDDNHIASLLTPYIVHQMSCLLKLPLNRRRIICLGEGKNYKFLSALNAVYGWYEMIIPLAHPRFIMQYKRKSIDRYIDLYIQALNLSYSDK